jgi:hypothetical protein
VIAGHTYRCRHLALGESRKSCRKSRFLFLITFFVCRLSDYWVDNDLIPSREVLDLGAFYRIDGILNRCSSANGVLRVTERKNRVGRKSHLKSWVIMYPQTLRGQGSLRHTSADALVHPILVKISLCPNRWSLNVMNTEYDCEFVIVNSKTKSKTQGKTRLESSAESASTSRFVHTTRGAFGCPERASAVPSLEGSRTMST